MRASILLHTALQAEAQPLIKRLGLQKHSIPGSFELFGDSLYSLVVSGMGKTKSAAAIAAAATRLFPDRRDFFILNVGIAGSPSIAIGTLCSVVKCIDTSSARDFYPDLIESQPGTECILETHDSPVRDAKILLGDSTLVDMEASAVFESGRMFSSASRVQSFKVVSDQLACSIPSKAFISELIEENLDPLCDYLETLQSSPAFTSKLLSSEEGQLLEGIAGALGLTFSQRVQLENAASYCKAKHGQLPSNIPLPAAEKLNSKSVRTIAFTAVRTVLEA